MRSSDPRWAVALVVIVGMSGPLSSALGVQTAAGLSRLTFSSPVPRVFYQPEIAVEITLEIEGTQGERLARIVDAAELSRVRGPLARRQPYVAPIFVSVPQELERAIYRHGFCTAGPLATAFGIAFPVARVRLHIGYRAPAFAAHRRTLEVTCGST